MAPKKEHIPSYLHQPSGKWYLVCLVYSASRAVTHSASSLRPQGRAGLGVTEQAGHLLLSRDGRAGNFN